MKINLSAMWVVLLLLLPFQGLAQEKTYPSLITVAQDGSGDFKTIQEAVNSVRDLSQQRVTIHVMPGTYQEKLIIPASKINICLKGDDATKTIITNGDYSGKLLPEAEQTATQQKYSTFNSYTVIVRGNDFRAENLTIVNSAGRVGQAVALHVEGDRCALFNCRILGNQDTIYTANDSNREYYQNCWIEGTTDFIFGSATCVFQDCTIKSLANSYVTAASTSQRQAYGYVFLRCKLISDGGVNKVYLGRPWRPYARVVFADCSLGSHILPAGWHNWSNPANEQTAFYAEYNNSGSGANISQRVTWSKQLTAPEMADYTIAHILGRMDGWDPVK